MLYMASGRQVYLCCKSFLPADFVIPDGRIRLIQLSLGFLVLVSQFCLLGVYELNICGSVHHV